MKILVIGASGFIGQTVGRAAAKRGYEVIATSCHQAGGSYIKYDMLYDDIREILKAYHIMPKEAYILICSAMAKIDRCYEDREGSYALNVTATRNLMELLADRQYKFAFISSDAVFDGGSGYYTEESACSAISEYGRQKAQMEQYILEKLPEGLIFRVSILIDKLSRKGNILSDFCANARAGKPICCMKDRIFCPTYVEDVAQVMIRSFEEGLKGIYNVANREIYSRKELAELFVQRGGFDVPVMEKPEEWFPFKDRRHRKSCLITEKLRRDLPYTFTPVDEVVEGFIRSLS